MALIQHAWAGEPHRSESIKYVNGNETARNTAFPPTGGTGLQFIYASVDYGQGEITLTCTNESSSSTLPRVQRINNTDYMSEVDSGGNFYLRAEVLHDRGMPVHINAWFLKENGDYEGWQILGENVLADGWQVAHVSGTVPEDAAYLGWQVRVDSSTEHGPSFEGDTFKIRHMSPFPDYFDGDTPDYYDTVTAKVYHENGWAEFRPKFYA